MNIKSVFVGKKKKDVDYITLYSKIRPDFPGGNHTGSCELKVRILDRFFVFFCFFKICQGPQSKLEVLFSKGAISLHTKLAVYYTLFLSHPTV